MGFGLPSALGAAAAFDGRDGRPAKIVVDIDGDGRCALLFGGAWAPCSLRLRRTGCWVFAITKCAECQ